MSAGRARNCRYCMLVVVKLLEQFMDANSVAGARIKIADSLLPLPNRVRSHCTDTYLPARLVVPFLRSRVTELADGVSKITDVSACSVVAAEIVKAPRALSEFEEMERVDSPVSCIHPAESGCSDTAKSMLKTLSVLERKRTFVAVVAGNAS